MACMCYKDLSLALGPLILMLRTGDLWMFIPELLLNLLYGVHSRPFCFLIQSHYLKHTHCAVKKRMDKRQRRTLVYLPTFHADFLKVASKHMKISSVGHHDLVHFSNSSPLCHFHLSPSLLSGYHVLSI